MEEVFVGRKQQLEEFDEFLSGERPNWGSRGKGAPVLLVVGERGMGKTALLQGMAHRATGQGHFVVVGDVDERHPEFSEQIYPLIAMLKGEKCLELGEGRHWLKAGLVGLGMLGGICGLAAGLGSLLTDIRHEHTHAGSTRITLAHLFHYALSKTDAKIGGAKRIVVFLDTEKISSPAVVPLMRILGDIGIPPKVRFVIAQKPKDRVITAVEDGELRDLCTEPIYLGKIELEEELIEFIEVYDTNGKLTELLRDVFLRRYGGWPLLMKLALVELGLARGEITEEVIRSLPPDLDGFWAKRYDKVKSPESRAIVQTVCLLPHPYSKADVAQFAALELAELDAASADSAIWQLLERVDYEEPFWGKVFEDCPFPKHATVGEYILEELSKFEEFYLERLSAIISHYRNLIGDDLEGADVDRDALLNITRYYFKIEDWENFFKEVNRLTPIKRRYGLIESCKDDNEKALRLSEAQRNMELVSEFSGTLGLIYWKQGELDRAEKMHRNALAINEKFENKKGMARNYGNLGSVYWSKKELDKAEKMHRKSLEIHEKIENEEGIALAYGNLGPIYQEWSELDKAETMNSKALKIYRDMHHKEGMASAYHNLGILYFKRALLELDKAAKTIRAVMKLNCEKRCELELEKAKKMFRKALKINKDIGRKEGMALQYGNLGRLILETQGDWDTAERMLRKARKIFRDIGCKEHMAKELSYLADIYESRCMFDKAEEMRRKAQEIEKQLGLQKSISDP